MGELEGHDLKKYLMIIIKTIDFPDEPADAIMQDMDINTYALEILVEDRLARARSEAAVQALLGNGGARPPRVPVRVSLGLALIGLGRWLRGAGCCSGVVGGRLGPQVA
ncbi:MAG: hypothetical protein HY511_08920 [Actinobacteria bacterium]|nr:hypothetical protein [Actinomycetota bacterium]